jgi:putative hydrolase of the HAD superfamily
MIKAMTKLTTVFFDWGGVIANDPGDDFLAQLLRDIGATEEQIQEIFERYMKQFMRGEISEADYWRELHAQYGLRIHDTISDEFLKWQGLRANPDILALVNEVKAVGLQTAIFSNVIEPTYNVLSQAGYYDRFDAVLASCKVGLAKPETAFYEQALLTLNTTAEQSLFIDDKQTNLTPAAAMGFTTILAKNPGQIVHDVRCAVGLL